MVRRALKFGDNPLDQWILSKLQTLKLKVTTEIENYKLYNVVPVLFEVIELLTNWYVLNRSRFWAETLSRQDLRLSNPVHLYL